MLMLALLAASSLAAAEESAEEGIVMTRGPIVVRPLPRYVDGVVPKSRMHPTKYKGIPYELPRSTGAHSASGFSSQLSYIRALESQLATATRAKTTLSDQQDVISRQAAFAKAENNALREQLKTASRQIQSLHHEAKKNGASPQIMQYILEQDSVIKTLRATIEGYKAAMNALAAGVTSYMESQGSAPVKRKTTMEPAATTSETESDEEPDTSPKIRRISE